ncbi:Imm61 family immunity protein [Mycolicibacterium mengxianglii]|uniref:Imm61 family immunity protein n=1 Tax=Mycolicibacterium mengxianglii TaxID=2736649 RepID=UPI0018D18BCB|nr:Imm61 family immunity protein [Mycolicibacterium mengxianglii]
MTIPFNPSLNLIAFSTQAGFEFKHDEAGAGVFYNIGWANRLFIRPRPEGFLRISKASRNDAEQYLLDAEVAAAAEAFFWMTFGSDVRAEMGLPGVQLPISRGEVYPPFVICELGESSLVLTDGEKRPVVSVRRKWDPALDIGRLVKISCVLAASPEAVQASFLDPTGSPLFTT